jgi:Ca2+-binding RTX toxin-like protein
VPGQGDNTLRSDEFANPTATDHPVLPAVGNPAFADLEGAGQMSFITPAAGLIRALDLALPEYQQTGQDYLMAWAVETGAGGLGAGDVRVNFPQQVNDLQFLTGPSVSDIDPALPGQEILEGTASKDLQAFSTAGAQVLTPGGNGTPAWPKVTTDWTVATPLIGSWGTQDTEAGARKVVIGMTRSGYLNAYETGAGACTPSASPRFHHDNANSGFYGRDAVLPGRPYDAASTASELTFRAPGDDLLCGTATAYEVVTSASPIDEDGFSSARSLGGAPAPAQPGVTQSYVPPSGAARYIAIRAVDDQGNVGRPALFDRGPGGGPGPGPGGRCKNVVRGGPRGQALRGTRSGDRILGFRGRDRIFGFGGQDCLDGGRGNDRVAGHKGHDVLRGRRGADRLFAGPGRDIVRGGLGRDRVRGGAGRDRLLGGAGIDIVFARDRRRDVVKCGKGRRDRAVVDRRDRVRGCEVVRRRRG